MDWLLVTMYMVMKKVLSEKTNKAQIAISEKSCCFSRFTNSLDDIKALTYEGETWWVNRCSVPLSSQILNTRFVMAIGQLGKLLHCTAVRYESPVRSTVILMVEISPFWKFQLTPSSCRTVNSALELTSPMITNSELGA